MSDETPQRPPQVVVSTGLIVAGSLVLLLLAFHRMGEVGSLDFQDSAAKTISRDPFKTLGLTVDGLQTLTRVLAMIQGATAVAAAILGGFLLAQRSRPARIALSLLAPLIVVSGFDSGTLPAVLVAATIASLWAEPVRSWLAGTWKPTVPVGPTRPPIGSAGSAGSPTAAPPATPPSGPSQAQPGPLPWGSPTDAGGPALPPVAPPWAPPGHPGYPAFTGPAAAAERRPGQVVGACVVTWASSAIVALFFVLSELALAVMPDELRDQLEPRLQDAGVSLHQLQVVFAVVAVVVVLWCAVAAVLAVLVLRHRRGAWVGLVVCTALAGVLALLSVFKEPAAIVVLAACIATLTLLLRPETQRWIESGPTGHR